MIRLIAYTTICALMFQLATINIDGKPYKEACKGTKTCVVKN